MCQVPGTCRGFYDSSKVTALADVRKVQCSPARVGVEWEEWRCGCGVGRVEVCVWVWRGEESSVQKSVIQLREIWHTKKNNTKTQLREWLTLMVCVLTTFLVIMPGACNRMASRTHLFIEGIFFSADSCTGTKSSPPV